jgi:hypothetical protein
VTTSDIASDQQRRQQFAARKAFWEKPSVSSCSSTSASSGGSFGASSCSTEPASPASTAPSSPVSPASPPPRPSLQWKDWDGGESLTITHEIPIYEDDALECLFILLLCPSTRQFELLPCQVPLGDRLTIADTLDQLPILASSPRLRQQTYHSLCRDDCELLNLLVLQEQTDIGDVLLAIPSGYAPKHVRKEVGNGVLEHPMLIKAIKQARRTGRGLQMLMSSSEWQEKKQRLLSKHGEAHAEQNVHDDDAHGVPKPRYDYVVDEFGKASFSCEGFEVESWQTPVEHDSVEVELEALSDDECDVASPPSSPLDRRRQRYRDRVQVQTAIDMTKSPSNGALSSTIPKQSLKSRVSTFNTTNNNTSSSLSPKSSIHHPSKTDVSKRPCLQKSFPRSPSGPIEWTPQCEPQSIIRSRSWSSPFWSRFKCSTADQWLGPAEKYPLLASTQVP